MITVIIAGGSGTRLWPLSTPNYPKHLLSLNGQGSLLQNTYERAKKISSAIYVVTDASHAHHVKKQLADMPIEHVIVEPARRGTASCIVAGLERIVRTQSDVSEPIAFIHADHYIRDWDGFAHTFRVAGETAVHEGRIVLVGVEPDHPSTGFGYIKKGGLRDEKMYVYSVQRFEEKPSHEVAKRYVSSGNYLWNCGYFVAPVDTFLASMEKHAPKLFKNYQDLHKTTTKKAYEEVYLGFENIAIDYALIEKVDDLLVVPAAFDWMDMGSFIDLHKASGTNEAGNHAHGKEVALYDVENSYIWNESDKPIAVIGLDNVVVVHTEHGILVARKDLSQRVGEVAKEIQARKKA